MFVLRSIVRWMYRMNWLITLTFQRSDVFFLKYGQYVECRDPHPTIITTWAVAAKPSDAQLRQQFFWSTAWYPFSQQRNWATGLQRVMATPNRLNAEGEATDVDMDACLERSIESVTGWEHISVHRIPIYPKITASRLTFISFPANRKVQMNSKKSNPSRSVSKGLPKCTPMWDDLILSFCKVVVAFGRARAGFARR